MEVQQIESVRFIKENSEYKGMFIEFMLTVWEVENTVRGADFHGA